MLHPLNQVVTVVLKYIIIPVGLLGEMCQLIPLAVIGYILTRSQVLFILCHRFYSHMICSLTAFLGYPLWPHAEKLAEVRFTTN